jgi:hypothetical protein
VALGLLLALGDLRLQGLDLLPDPLGYLIALAGLRRLGAHDSRFRMTTAAAAVTGVLSLADLVETDDALVGSVQTGYGVAQTVLLVLLCLALRGRAGEAGDTRSASRLSSFAVALSVLGVVVLLLLTVLSGADDAGDVLGAGVPLLVVGLIDLAVALWLVLVLLRLRREPWAQEEPVRAAPPAAAAPSAG